MRVCVSQERRGEADEGQWGMAVSSCGPASLLDLYLAHDRLSEAVGLVEGCVAGWGAVDARLRQKHAATWFPHTRIKVRCCNVLMTHLRLHRPQLLFRAYKCHGFEYHGWPKVSMYLVCACVCVLYRY